MPDARTDFEWSRYADATLAGLSVLIPIPFVDDAFEAFFRKRIPGAVANARGRPLSGEVRAVLEEEDAGRGGCATLPARLVIGLFKRLSRKLLYFLAVKQATDRLSHYWYRAFLVDHMLASGHLESPDSARMAHQAMEELLATTAGPLTRLARQMVTQMHHVWPALRRARRSEESEEVRQTRNQAGAAVERVRGAPGRGSGPLRPNVRTETGQLISAGSRAARRRPGLVGHPGTRLVTPVMLAPAVEVDVAPAIA